jgi:hypothetical protein
MVGMFVAHRMISEPKLSCLNLRHPNPGEPMSFEHTVDVRGVRHGVVNQILTAGRDSTFPATPRCHLACGGYVETTADAMFIVVTCVRCIAAERRYVQLQGDI